ncbi:hypothetical protein [Palleronia caenipelagi]|uniref:Lipoprotein n=1 Tax=Palleronia caenipelagi TaxID=2489174 RepID=A0A547Q545_9RHOB|nr:hypothetical protein [Palleronia caenipelagi]TRD21501.1 hypothetical protein FEV53_08440 [Palleronia caenipelagi]
MKYVIFLGLLALVACNIRTEPNQFSDQGRFLAAIEAQGCSFDPENPPAFAATNVRTLNEGQADDIPNSVLARAYTDDLIEQGVLRRGAGTDGRPLIFSNAGRCAAS